jgi:hypothetical protein
MYIVAHKKFHLQIPSLEKCRYGKAVKSTESVYNSFMILLDDSCICISQYLKFEGEPFCALLSDSNPAVDRK